MFDQEAYTAIDVRSDNDRARSDVAINAVDVSSYVIPTDAPESDGTLEWNSTTIVIAQVTAGGQQGLGYTYGDAACADVIRRTLSPAIIGMCALSPSAAWWAMRRIVRNVPQRGLAMYAISALDTAIWDLKARLLELSLVDLLGGIRPSSPMYGSGGFTSYADSRLCDQLSGWVRQDIPRVKMKIGRSPDVDPGRVRAARQAIGDDAELFVDANGALSATQAIRLARVFERYRVSWFEEPRPSDDCRGLARVRSHLPPGMDLAAGEYITSEHDAAQLVGADCVDVIQPDVTRCGGITGVMRIAHLCGAEHVPISLHCAPALAVQIACACREVRHIEYFHDHVRLENMLFEGVPQVHDGMLSPDHSRSGHGLSIRADRELEKFRI